MRNVIGVLAAGACLFWTGAAFAGSETSDACMAVASAKFEQWRQPRVLVLKTRTFANGFMLTDEIIATPNTAYVLHRGHWWTGNIPLSERGARSPQHMLMNMGLAECAQGGAAQIAGQPAKLYNYRYVADRNGFAARGAMWISDVSGLPLREELHETAPPANALVATAIATTYAYNADVQIPVMAANVESDRMYRTKSMIEHMQISGPPAGKAN